MRRRLRLAALAVWLLSAFASSAGAQLAGPVTISAQDAGACATANACATFGLGDDIVLSIDVSGSWTGTLTFEQTVNGTDWRAITVTSLADNSTAQTTSANGSFVIPNLGVGFVRVRATTLGSGSAVIFARKGFASARASPTGLAPFFITKDGLVTTSTDGIVLANRTAATAGVPVQMSPRLRWVGTAWDTAASETVAFFAEVLPATAATPTGAWKLGYSLNGAAAIYPLVVLSGSGGRIGVGGITASFPCWQANGATWDAVLCDNSNFTSVRAATLTSTTSSGIGLALGAGATVTFSGRSALGSTADKLIQALDNAAATGIEESLGTATLGTCTAGAIVSGSHNFAGSYTGNTSGSCVINFGAPNFTNAPFCSAHSRASTTHPRISAVSTSSITITGGVSGEQIDYFCRGRIGT